MFFVLLKRSKQWLYGFLLFLFVILCQKFRNSNIQPTQISVSGLDILSSDYSLLGDLLIVVHHGVI